MQDKMRLNKAITIFITFILLLIISIVSGINIMSFQLLVIVAIGIGILIGFQVLLIRLSEKHKNFLIKYLLFIVIALILVISANIIFELATNSILIYRKTIPGVILFICTAPTLILLFLLVDRYVSQKNLYIAFQSFIILAVVVLGVFDLLLLLTSSSLTEVDFENPDITLYLIEDTFIFSSSHSLYKKVSPFYGVYLKHDGSWTCNDGCITESPESYSWEWVNDKILIVSYEYWDKDITYYVR